MPASCRCTIVMNAGISLACETTDMHMHIMNCANFFGFIVRRCVRFQCTHANAGTGLCECRWDVVWQQNHAAHTQSQPDNCVCVCGGDVWPNEGEGEIALMWSANHRTRAGIDCSLPVHNFFVFCVLQFIECIFLSLFRGYRRFLLDWRRIIAWFFNWLSFVCENERALGVTVTSASRHQQSPTSPLQLSISELCSE